MTKRYVPAKDNNKGFNILSQGGKLIMCVGTFLCVLPPFSLLPARNLLSTPKIDSVTTEVKRTEFKKHLFENVIHKNLSLTLNKENEEKWMGAYWGCKFSYYKGDIILNSLKEAIKYYEQGSSEFNRATLEAIYTLFPFEFKTEIREILNKTANIKHFAMASAYLLRMYKNENPLRKEIAKLMKAKFPMWEDQPILQMLNYSITQGDRRLPDLKDLLSLDFGNGQPVIFSFQRRNRDFEGLTIIRNTDGKFLRDSSGKIFYIHHLARALSKLPGYLTNGNTPTGVLSITGIDTSDNPFIGKTPFIVTALPGEIKASEFFRDPDLENIAWSKELYEELLPSSWKGYFPVYETFYAGMAGRSEIVMHGTTIDPEFYKEFPFYPNTPSLGCLTAKELYSPENGTLIVSDQQTLVDQFLRCGKRYGFLVVIELDNKESKVELSEILPFISEP